MKSPNQHRPDEVRDKWENLGLAFAIKQSGLTDADPERTFIGSLKEFQDDRKLLGLILSWLREFGSLLHTERIKALAADLSAAELAWLGGIAHWQSQEDRRWRVICSLIEKKLGKPAPRFQTSKLDELQAEKSGVDQGFFRYGITIPTITPADPKKLRPRQDVIKNNLWFRMRLLFGTNWRADIASVILLRLVKTSYQAEKVLACSRETAYRNWQALKEAGIEGLFDNLV
jgi:hypothetical protein